ncbi:hypothetical protein [Phaeobacter sp.]|uniref:hypothetical protein n=1 Tax=Phaeobacter sp. TaxID=1902409 RepID=UPI0025D5CF8E|nr:hypothetical protein [Phaeobacter sp.]
MAGVLFWLAASGEVHHQQILSAKSMVCLGFPVIVMGLKQLIAHSWLRSIPLQNRIACKTDRRGVE